MSRETFVHYATYTATQYGSNSFSTNITDGVLLRNKSAMSVTCPDNRVTNISASYTDLAGLTGKPTIVSISFTLNGGGGSTSISLYFKVTFTYDSTIDNFYIGNSSFTQVFGRRSDLRNLVISNYHDIVVNGTNNDSWNATTNLSGFRRVSGSTIMVLKSGTSPTFDSSSELHWYAYGPVDPHDNPSFYTLTVSNNRLTITNDSTGTTVVNMTPSDFAEKAIPTRYVVLMQAGGGGGGYDDRDGLAYTGGSGGGGGGFICGILHTPYSDGSPFRATIVIGQGGFGGTLEHPIGNNGGTTGIADINDSDNYYVCAVGGGGGRPSESTPAGVKGGSEVYSSFTELKRVDGTNGTMGRGSASSGYDADNIVQSKIWATSNDYQRNINSSLYSYPNSPTTRYGGKGKWNNGGGGGGASYCGSGGDGASGYGSSGQAEDGATGAGGGGGGNRNIGTATVDYDKLLGGDGGRGFFAIYY